MPARLPARLVGGLIAALGAAVALSATAPATADEKKAEALVDEARFVEHCLGKVDQALPLYEKALREGPTGRVLGEALYGKARALHAAERTAQAEAILEELSGMRRDDALRPWPQRAEKALSALLSGRDPYFRPERATGELTLRETRRPILEVLLELRKQAGAGMAIDGSFPEPWYVTVDAGPLAFGPLCERIVGSGRVRALGDGAFVLGEVASDLGLLQRAFRYQDLTDHADRRVASVLRTRRADLSMPAISLIEASRLLREVAGCEVELAPHALAVTTPVRVWVEDAPIDVALDLVAHPLGLTWRIRGGKILIEKRARRDED